MIGQSISHYKILEKLGAGGMGVVYKAHDTKLDRDVALKFLPHHLAATPEEQARFLQEARAASALNHPNVCTIYDIAEHDGPASSEATAGKQQFIVMEYIDGKTLRQMVPVQKTQTAIDYAIQIGEALQEAHSKGIVHRDVKTDNIMVNSKNQIKVMDFGLAKLKGSLKLTRTSSTVGTLAYMAPEQIQGGEVDARSDIFSFGVVLFEMLTSHLPFRGEHEAAMMYSILNEQPEPLQKYLPEVPSELVHAVSRALEKDPEDRYQSIHEMVIDLRRLKKETSRVVRATEEVGGSLSRTARGGPIRRRWLIGIGAMLVLLSATAAYFLFYRPASGLDPRRVAVAVFENRTGDPSLDGIGTMITESVSQGLGSSGAVEAVPSEAAIRAWKAIQSQTQEADLLLSLAEVTKAGMIVSGAYYKQRDSLVVHAKLTDAATGKTLRTMRPIACEVQNPKSAVDQVQEHMMGAVAFQQDLSSLEYKDLPGYYPVFAAFKEFRAGMNIFTRGQWLASIVHYRRSAQLDPTFALAMWWEAGAYYNSGRLEKADSIAQVLESSRQFLVEPDAAKLDYMQGGFRGDLLACLVAARKMANKSPIVGGYLRAICALQVNYLNEAKEVSLAMVPSPKDSTFLRDWVYNWDIKTSALHLLGDHDRELKEALKGRQELPDRLGTLTYEFRALCALGRVEEIWKRAEEVRAFSTGGGTTFGGMLIMCTRELRYHGFPEASQKAVEKAIGWYTSRPDSEQQSTTRQSALASALYLAGRYDDAREIYKKLLQKRPDNLNYQGYLGTIAARLRDTTEARRFSLLLKNMSRPYILGQHTYWRARIAALLGEKEESVNLLREALGQGRSYELIHADADLENLRDYQPFKELMKSKD